MRRLHALEQTMCLFAAFYYGMAMEDWTVGAPRANLYMNGAFALIVAAVAGTLYLFRRQRERAADVTRHAQP